VTAVRIVGGAPTTAPTSRSGPWPRTTPAGA